jgi:class 3 adenylate cyclase
VHKGARIASAAHGGQVVISAETRAHLGGVALTDLGEHRLKDFDEPVRLYQLGDPRYRPLSPKLNEVSQVALIVTVPSGCTVK